MVNVIVYFVTIIVVIAADYMLQRYMEYRRNRFVINEP